MLHHKDSSMPTTAMTIILRIMSSSSWPAHVNNDLYDYLYLPWWRHDDNLARWHLGLYILVRAHVFNASVEGPVHSLLWISLCGPCTSGLNQQADWGVRTTSETLCLVSGMYCRGGAIYEKLTFLDSSGRASRIEKFYDHRFPSGSVDVQYRLDGYHLLPDPSL